MSNIKSSPATVVLHQKYEKNVPTAIQRNILFFKTHHCVSDSSPLKLCISLPMKCLPATHQRLLMKGQDLLHVAETF